MEWAPSHWKSSGARLWNDGEGCDCPVELPAAAFDLLAVQYKRPGAAVQPAAAGPGLTQPGLAWGTFLGRIRASTVAVQPSVSV